MQHRGTVLVQVVQAQRRVTRDLVVGGVVKVSTGNRSLQLTVMYVISVTDALHGNYAASNYLEPKAAVKQNNTL